MDTLPTLDDAARAFLTSALVALRREHIVPTPVFNPFLRVGRDYFGDSIRGTKDFGPFEAAIGAHHPRFSDDTPLRDRDFASGYVFSFLEACVAEAVLSREELSPDSPSVERCLSDLVSVIEADSWEVACCREVTSLTTGTGQPLEFEDVMVNPVVASASDHSREAADLIAEVIPHSQSCYDRESPGGFGPPHSIVVARDNAKRPFDAAKPESTDGLPGGWSGVRLVGG